MQDNAQGYLAVRGPYAIVPDTAGVTDLTPANDPLANGYFTGNVTAGAYLLVGGGGLMSNPMTTAGDIIYGLALGVPAALPIGFNQQVLTLVAGLPKWANASSGIALSVKNNQTVNNSTVPVDATDLVATVLAGTTYAFRAVLMTNNTAAAGAFFQLNGTATFTILKYWIRVLTSTAIWTTQANINAFANGLGATVVLIVGYIEGVIAVNVGGTVQPQFSNNVAAGNTILQAGSSFILTIVP